MTGPEPPQPPAGEAAGRPPAPPGISPERMRALAPAVARLLEALARLRELPVAGQGLPAPSGDRRSAASRGVRRRRGSA